MNRVIAALVLVAVAASTAGLLWLSRPAPRVAIMPAYCVTDVETGPCREMDTRNKTEFRA